MVRILVSFWDDLWAYFILFSGVMLVLGSVSITSEDVFLQTHMVWFPKSFFQTFTPDSNWEMIQFEHTFQLGGSKTLLDY